MRRRRTALQNISIRNLLFSTKQRVHVRCPGRGRLLFRGRAVFHAVVRSMKDPSRWACCPDRPRFARGSSLASSDRWPTSSRVCASPSARPFGADKHAFSVLMTACSRVFGQAHPYLSPCSLVAHLPITLLARADGVLTSPFYVCRQGRFARPRTG